MMSTSVQEIDVSRWRKIAELGSGRTGSVTLCFDANSADHGVFHAVKCVQRRRCIISPSATRRVLQEKNALQNLKGHPGIVDLRFTCKDDENLYFILEPLLGGPLYKHIRAGPQGFLEVPTARFYASEIVSAIAHMHGLHFMHRDLKASNIVLCAGGHVKLVDLGSSKQVKPRASHAGDSDSDDVFWEKSYTYCGTPHCMAPEMISREGHTPAVDWWAVGILIHEMTTGQPPFGYGGCDLHLRIAAGIPRDREEGCAPETMEREADAAIYLPVVRRLLDTNPRNRLGSDGGADAIMSHAWFASIDWTKIRQNEVEPPHFRKDLGELGALEEEKASATDAKTGDWFAEF